MELIFVVGKKRSGKDTVADYITNPEKSYGVKYQFGGPIKDLLASAWEILVKEYNQFELGVDDFHGQGIDRETPLALSNDLVSVLLEQALDLAKSYYGLRNRALASDILADILVNNIEAWSIRRLMQTLGTDLCVSVDKMVWVRLFSSEYIDCIGQSIQPEYFVVPDTRQTNELAVGRAMGATIIHVVGASDENTDEHITEQGLPIGPDDYVIHNTGTLDELYYKIDSLLENLND